MAEIPPSSSSAPSSPPPIEQQSPDSIDDQLNSLSLEPQNDAEINNGGDSVERESEGDAEEKRDREVEDVSHSENDNGNGNGNENGNNEREKSRRSSGRFPVREDAENCSFYVRTGMCKFGMNCKFNHPPDRKVAQGGKVKRKEESGNRSGQKLKENDESLDKEGPIDCKYFDRPGGCKFGKACKFNHSRKTSSAVELNFMGLPVRPGEKECPYYMLKGSCKYGANCRFNHPDPTSIGAPDALPSYTNGGSVLSSNASQSTLAPFPPSNALNGSPPYMPLMFPPTQGIPPRPDWTAYQAPVYPAERNMTIPPAYAVNSPSSESNLYTRQPEQTLADEFPERPGQPECSYFLKTGNCKYRSACKFHHPKSASATLPPCTLSDLGLPLRPGESVCNYYNRYGICKYGPGCKYDHPVNYAHSTSPPVSAVETPVLGASLVSNNPMVGGG